MIRRAFLALVGTALLSFNLAADASANSQPNNYTRQAGIVSVDPTDQWNVGARSRFSAPNLPQPTVDNAANAFWVGQVLSDGSFFQAGMIVNDFSCGSSCMTWFSQGFDPGNHIVLNWTSAGAPSSGYHTVAIQLQQIGQTFNWYPTFDGTRYQGSDWWPNAPNSGNHTPEIFAEVSLAPAGPIPDAGDTMGPTTATSKALQTEFQGIWYDTYHADTFFVNQVCPPINVVGWGYQSASAGTNLGGYACVSDWSILW